MTADPPPEEPKRFVSRGGRKLEAALDHFQIDVRGRRCADFGCNVGGFTDCLLQRGAAHVYAIDTGYGTLAYALRTDARVTVLERTNALHAEPPTEPVDLVAIDLAWTKQQFAIPAALTWLAPGGIIVTLIKPHYEARATADEALLAGGVLPEEAAARLAQRAIDSACAATAKLTAAGLLRSPVRGGKGRGGGNVEFLAMLRHAR